MNETESLNSFNLVSFYPSSEPRNAFVFIIQTWHDTRLAEGDLRSEIRKAGEALYNNFKSHIHHPTVRKRWELENSKENFIVKHVRYTDLNEVLGVTVDGETYFDYEIIKQTANSV
ncbi:MAG: hypothetical protein ACYSTS_17625 [Planctomycetota bacterium]